MKSLLSIAFAAITITALCNPVKSRKPVAVPLARPQQHNQFVTVEELMRAQLAVRTPVSVEGYAVVGYRPADGSVWMRVIDSVDHVLNKNDANFMARDGATCVVPSTLLPLHAGWTWDAKGFKKFIMYTGAHDAVKELHDVVDKLRITGWSGQTKGVIQPVTKIEFQDPNGNWKALR